MRDIPAEPGSYALELFLEQAICLQVGKSGVFLFPAGGYLYLGSAHGPGGLRARLGRHLHPGQPPALQWHIDYLRQHAAPTSCVFLPNPPQPARLECRWSQLIDCLPGSGAPAPGFGASDCPSGCRAHLFHFATGAPGELLACGDLRRELARLAGADEATLCYQGPAPAVK